MSITKEQLKETLRNIMKEESDYQAFFKAALEKAGKSIPSMSDEEKKAFFNKIDAAWDGKGEKNEELTGNQHKLDIDGDGEIEASDLAALRAGEKKEESVNEGKPRYYQQDGIGKAKYTISYHDGKKKHNDGSDVFDIKIFKNKKDLAKFINILHKLGFVYGFAESVSVNEATLKQGTKLRYDKNNFVVDYVVDKKYTGKDGFDKYILKVVKSNFPNKIKVGSTEEYEDSKLTGLIRNKVMNFIKNESVNEAASRTAMEIGGLTGLNKDAIQKFVDTHNMDIEKVYQYVKKAKLTDRLNFVTAIVGTPGNSVQNKMIKMFGESVNEAELPKDGSTIKVGNTRVKIKYVGKNKDYIGFNWEGDDGGSNYEETKVSDHKDMNSLINRIKDEIRHQRIVVSKRKSESVNEEKYPIAVEKFNKELIKHPMVKKAAQHYKKTPAEIVKVLQQRLYSKGDKTGNTKEVWIDFNDTTSGITIKHKMKFNESVNEGVSPKDMDKIKSAVEAASSFMNIGSELKKTGLKYVFATSPMPIYVVQPTPNNRVAIVNKKYASKPDFVHGDTAVGVMESIKSVNEEIAVGKMVKVVDNPHWEAALGKKGPFKRKVKGIYGDSVFFTDGSNSDMKYVKESIESVNEGRAFINAAKKAKAEGKTEFEFNGKTYPVTIKENLTEARLGKVALLKQVEKGNTSQVEGVKISPDLAFELRMFLERPIMARSRTGIAIDNSQMKDALKMMVDAGIEKRLSGGVKAEFKKLIEKYK